MPDRWGVMDMGSPYLDLIAFAGLLMTTVLVACALLAYRSLVSDEPEPDQDAYDRRFFEIVAGFEG